MASETKAPEKNYFTSEANPKAKPGGTAGSVGSGVGSAASAENIRMRTADGGPVSAACRFAGDVREAKARTRATTERTERTRRGDAQSPFALKVWLGWEKHMAPGPLFGRVSQKSPGGLNVHKGNPKPSAYQSRGHQSFGRLEWTANV